MFKDLETVLGHTARTAPDQIQVVAQNYIADAAIRLLDATPQVLAEELRNPTTSLVAVRQATTNEAVARILIAWTT